MYKESQLDRKNRKWFADEKSVNSLKRIKVSSGHIRGVYPSEINFSYPITAIVGENGSGKSTYLSLIACAFHNSSDFCPSNRMRPGMQEPRKYYTYSDFFTFTPDEHGIAGIQIQADYQAATGIKTDIRKKKSSGKWTDYNRRPIRSVTYLGINRIVPPSESSPHKHYCRKFTEDAPLSETQIRELRDAMSKILGRDYSGISLKKYGTYRLFSAQRSGTDYTGFNMGAGENAVLGLLLEIIAAGRGALIVVDEIDLGLHAKAQSMLVRVLKEFCEKYHCQIICSTHSKMVLDELPLDARFFIRRKDNTTDIIPNITSEFAFGELSGHHGIELSVFTEDDVAAAFLTNSLPLEIRNRIHIIPIGSDQAVLKHLAVHYREEDYRFIAFLDGDKRNQKTQAITQIKKHLEIRLNHSEKEFDDLMEQRLQYLPGEIWPEAYLIQEALNAENKDDLCEDWGASKADIISMLEQAKLAGKHSEFYTLAECTSLDKEHVRVDIIRFYKKSHEKEIAEIRKEIENILNQQEFSTCHEHS